MNDPPQREADNREVIDMLIAISVVARHLARKLEERNQDEEKEHEQDERPDRHPGGDDRNRPGPDHLRREPDQRSEIYAALARGNRKPQRGITEDHNNNGRLENIQR